MLVRAGPHLPHRSNYVTRCRLICTIYAVARRKTNPRFQHPMMIGKVAGSNVPTLSRTFMFKNWTLAGPPHTMRVLCPTAVYCFSMCLPLSVSKGTACKDRKLFAECMQIYKCKPANITTNICAHSDGTPTVQDGRQHAQATAGHYHKNLTIAFAEWWDDESRVLVALEKAHLL